jgi:hypothetical protein
VGGGFPQVAEIHYKKPFYSIIFPLQYKSCQNLQIYFQSKTKKICPEKVFSKDIIKYLKTLVLGPVHCFALIFVHQEDFWNFLVCPAMPCPPPTELTLFYYP